MTAMPEMVGLFNGFGGGASVLVAGAALVATVNAVGAGVGSRRHADEGRHRALGHHRLGHLLRQSTSPSASWPSSWASSGSSTPGRRSSSTASRLVVAGGRCLVRA